MRRLLVCVIGLVLAAPAAADGAGGPVPPVQGAAGVSAPGSDVNYIAIAMRGGTLVQRVQRGTGTVERYRMLRGHWGVPGVTYDGATTGASADGRRIVLAEQSRSYPPRRTRLLMLDTQLRPRRHIDLKGFYTVDAIAPNGRWLYFLHYPSARNILRYEVLAYDMRARNLLTKPIVDPREPDEKMFGIPVTRTVSPDGRWAYTLYQKTGGEMFIHALDTKGRTAACIDLDALGTNVDTSNVKLVLSGDGRTLSVETSAGPQSLVDTKSFEVSAPPVKQPKPAVRQRSAAPADDGKPWWPVAIVLAALAAVAAVLVRRRRVRPAPA